MSWGEIMKHILYLGIAVIGVPIGYFSGQLFFWALYKFYSWAFDEDGDDR